MAVNLTYIVCTDQYRLYVLISIAVYAPTVPRDTSYYTYVANHIRVGLGCLPLLSGSPTSSTLSVVHRIRPP